MKAVLSILLILTASSCLKLKGSFKAKEDLVFIHTTIFGNKKEKKVPAGTYQTSFKLQSENLIRLTFKKENNENSKLVKIQLPEGTHIPRNNGQIILPASETGQKYDLEGAIDTEQSTSGIYHGTESCTYTRYERHCRRVCRQTDDSSSNDRRCRRKCEYIDVTYYGYQSVSYRYRYTDKRLTLEILQPSTGQSLADYNGTYHRTQKIYEYRGLCH